MEVVFYNTRFKEKALAKLKKENITMGKMPTDPIKTLAEVITKNKELLQKQLIEVKEKYPLVMLSYRIQQAVLTEFSMPRLIADTEIGQLYTVIESNQNAEMVKISAEQSQRFVQLKTCLVRAFTVGVSGEYIVPDATDCFDAYFNL